MEWCPVPMKTCSFWNPFVAWSKPENCSNCPKEISFKQIPSGLCVFVQKNGMGSFWWWVAWCVAVRLFTQAGPQTKSCSKEMKGHACKFTTEESLSATWTVKSISTNLPARLRGSLQKDSQGSSFLQNTSNSWNWSWTMSEKKSSPWIIRLCADLVCVCFHSQLNIHTMALPICCETLLRVWMKQRKTSFHWIAWSLCFSVMTFGSTQKENTKNCVLLMKDWQLEWILFFSEAIWVCLKEEHNLFFKWSFTVRCGRQVVALS